MYDLFKETEEKRTKHGKKTHKKEESKNNAIHIALLRWCLNKLKRKKRYGTLPQRGWLRTQVKEKNMAELTMKLTRFSPTLVSYQKRI